MSTAPSGVSRSPDPMSSNQGRPTKRSFERSSEEQDAERSKRRRNDGEGEAAPLIESSRAAMARATTAAMERGMNDMDIQDDGAAQASVLEREEVVPPALPPLRIPYDQPRWPGYAAPHDPPPSLPPFTSLGPFPSIFSTHPPDSASSSDALPSAEAVRAELARAQAFSDTISPLRSAAAELPRPSERDMQPRFGDFTGPSRTVPHPNTPPDTVSSSEQQRDSHALPASYTPLSLSLPRLPPVTAPRNPPALVPPPPSPPRFEDYLPGWLRHPNMGGPSMLPAGQAGMRNLPPPAPYSPLRSYFNTATPPPPLPMPLYPDPADTGSPREYPLPWPHFPEPDTHPASNASQTVASLQEAHIPSSTYVDDSVQRAGTDLASQQPRPPSPWTYAGFGSVDAATGSAATSSSVVQENAAVPEPPAPEGSDYTRWPLWSPGPSDWRTHHLYSPPTYDPILPVTAAPELDSSGSTRLPPLRPWRSTEAGAPPTLPGPRRVAALVAESVDRHVSGPSSSERLPIYPAREYRYRDLGLDRIPPTGLSHLTSDLVVAMNPSQHGGPQENELQTSGRPASATAARTEAASSRTSRPASRTTNVQPTVDNDQTVYMERLMEDYPALRQGVTEARREREAARRRNSSSIRDEIQNDIRTDIMAFNMENDSGIEQTPRLPRLNMRTPTPERRVALPAPRLPSWPDSPVSSSPPSPDSSPYGHATRERHRLRAPTTGSESQYAQRPNLPRVADLHSGDDREGSGNEARRTPLWLLPPVRRPDLYGETRQGPEHQDRADMDVVMQPPSGSVARVPDESTEPSASTRRNRWAIDEDELFTGPSMDDDLGMGSSASSTRRARSAFLALADREFARGSVPDYVPREGGPASRRNSLGLRLSRRDVPSFEAEGQRIRAIRDSFERRSVGPRPASGDPRLQLRPSDVEPPRSDRLAEAMDILTAESSDWAARVPGATTSQSSAQTGRTVNRFMRTALEELRASQDALSRAIQQMDRARRLSDALSRYRQPRSGADASTAGLSGVQETPSPSSTARPSDVRSQADLDRARFIAETEPLLERSRRLPSLADIDLAQPYRVPPISNPSGSSGRRTDAESDTRNRDGPSNASSSPRRAAADSSTRMTPFYVPPTLPRLGMRIDTPPPRYDVMRAEANNSTLAGASSEPPDPDFSNLHYPYTSMEMDSSYNLPSTVPSRYDPIRDLNTTHDADLHPPYNISSFPNQDIEMTDASPIREPVALSSLLSGPASSDGTGSSTASNGADAGSSSVGGNNGSDSGPRRRMFPRIDEQPARLFYPREPPPASASLGGTNDFPGHMSSSVGTEPLDPRRRRSGATDPTEELSYATESFQNRLREAREAARLRRPSPGGGAPVDRSGDLETIRSEITSMMQEHATVQGSRPARAEDVRHRLPPFSALNGSLLHGPDGAQPSWGPMPVESAATRSLRRTDDVYVRPRLTPYIPAPPPLASFRVPPGSSSTPMGETGTRSILNHHIPELAQRGRASEANAPGPVRAGRPQFNDDDAVLRARRQYREAENSWNSILADRRGTASALAHGPGTQRATGASTSSAASGAVPRQDSRPMYHTRAPVFPGTPYSRGSQPRSVLPPDASSETSRHRLRFAPSLRSNRGDYMIEDGDWSYESLLRLTERVGPAQPRSTPGHIIASLKTGVYKDVSEADAAKACSICLEEYGAMDPVMYLSPCPHWFHRTCIEEWLKYARTCPCCRAQVGGTQRDNSGHVAPERLSLSRVAQSVNSGILRRSNSVSSLARGLGRQDGQSAHANWVPLRSRGMGMFPEYPSLRRDATTNPGSTAGVTPIGPGPSGTPSAPDQRPETAGGTSLPTIRPLPTPPPLPSPPRPLSFDSDEEIAMWYDEEHGDQEDVSRWGD